MHADSQIHRLQLIQNSLARAVTRTPRHHHITPVLKSLHWLKIPERIHFKVLSLTYNSLQSSQPTYLREPFTIQAPANTLYSIIILSHSFSTPGHFSSHVFQPSHINRSLRHVFGMTYHLNSAPFLRLHRRHCQSQDTIFICLLYPSPPGPSTQN